MLKCLRHYIGSLPVRRWGLRFVFIQSKFSDRPLRRNKSGGVNRLQYSEA